MCGICGLVSFERAGDLEKIVQAMCISISHRGPDGTGLYFAPPVVLGHNRLSIIDLSSAASQPMQSERFVIAFNGEIYNFEQLRKELGMFSFRSRSDTEVFLRAFEAWGVGCFPRLRGMFAAALWDKQEHKLTLVRDHFGIKPLYVTELPNGIAFSSEIKALLLLPEVSRQVDYLALSEYLAFGNALGDRTLFASIKKLPPGTYLTFSEGGSSRSQYWSPPIEQNNDLSFSDAANTTEALLRAAVRSQLVADVPVGIMLSGGIDSSLIAAFAAEVDSKRIKTFSLGFEFTPSRSELPKARMVADRLGTDHTELVIADEYIEQTLLSCASAHDEPFADAANIPLFLAARELKKHVTVVLQGDGGDEIFGGYRRYLWLRLLGEYPQLRSLFGLTGFVSNLVGMSNAARFFSILGLRDDAKRMAQLLIADPLQFDYQCLISREYRASLSDYYREYRRANEQFISADLPQRMLLTDATVLLPNTFLEKVDKPTMQHAIEVRVPLLDLDLAEYVMRLPVRVKLSNYQGKALLRAVTKRYLPPAIAEQKKQGFEVPYREWLRSPLKSLFEDAVLGNNSLPIDQTAVSQLFREHIRGGDSMHGFTLWKLLQLGIWTRNYNVTF